MRRLTRHGGKIFHVVPVGDLIEHDTALGSYALCACGPKVEPLELDDPRTIAVLVTHHALDGREHNEHDHNQETCPLCAARASGETP